MAYVKVAVRLRREARDDAGVFAARQIGIDNGTDEIGNGGLWRAAHCCALDELLRIVNDADSTRKYGVPPADITSRASQHAGKRTAWFSINRCPSVNIALPERFRPSLIVSRLTIKPIWLTIISINIDNAKH